MEVIYVLIPGMILMGVILVAILVIAIRKGQYDDLEGDGARILMDDDMMPDAPESEVKTDDKPEDNGEIIRREVD